MYLKQLLISSMVIKSNLKSNHLEAFKFFLPYIILSLISFTVIYFTGIYKYMGVVEGYGWNNSKLLDTWFKGLNLDVPRSWYIIIFPLYYFLISVPLQEYIFRVLPLKFLKPNQSPKDGFIYIAVISLIFALLHLYYMQPISVILVFGMGVLNAFSYSKHRSFLLICLFHLITASIAFTLNLA